MSELLQFENRKDAGRHLAIALDKYKRKPDTLVLALPRGGVPVADQVAKALELPMDIWLVRKLGVPGHEELAMGAIAVDGSIHLNQEIIHGFRIPPAALNAVIARENIEMERRNRLYRKGRPAPDIAGKTIIIVDDGLATGATMRAAVESLRQARADYIVAAAPVGATDSCDALALNADEVVCPYMPEPFFGVGQWYRDFSQTSDTEVQSILDRQELAYEK